MLMSEYITPVMYIDPSGESFIATFLVLTFMGFIIGGGSQYLANAMNGLEGADRWEGVLGAAIGGAIALPSILFPPSTMFLLATLSGVTNGFINEVERSVKYNQKFNFLSFAYDSTVYTLLNRVPFANSLTKHMIKTFVVDSLGYAVTDRLKKIVFDCFKQQSVDEVRAFENNNGIKYDWVNTLYPRVV